MPVPDQPDAATVPPTFLSRGVFAPAVGALPLSGVTILLVEDSRFASDGLRLICQRSGARLRRAETMAQARAHLRTYCPDVVIVDLGLPDGRGDRLIRDLAVSGRVAVVLGLSGDPDGRALAMAAGAKGFLEKPLQGVAAFQRAILRHVPGRCAPTLRDEQDRSVGADPLALRDDLAHAADLMAMAPDGAALAYVSRFVAGIARGAGDADLAAAAVAAGMGADGLPRLRHLVQRRLGEGATF